MAGVAAQIDPGLPVMSSGENAHSSQVSGLERHIQYKELPTRSLLTSIYNHINNQLCINPCLLIVVNCALMYTCAKCQT